MLPCREYRCVFEFLFKTIMVPKSRNLVTHTSRRKQLNSVLNYQQCVITQLVCSDQRKLVNMGSALSVLWVIALMTEPARVKCPLKAVAGRRSVCFASVFVSYKWEKNKEARQLQSSRMPFRAFYLQSPICFCTSSLSIILFFSSPKYQSWLKTQLQTLVVIS